MYLTNLIFHHDREQPDYINRDVSRILRILNDRGFTASPFDIRRAWEAYSEEFEASWLVMPSDEDQIFSIIMRYFKTL